MAQSIYPINRALEAAIVASADDDTPRLAYADWLDENGDHDRAEFIRVQCRLADLSPAEPDWIDLTERQEELVARLEHRFPPADLDRANRFYFGTDIIGAHEEPYRRGFPYFIACQQRGAEWTREETARTVSFFSRLVQTTTIRGFHPYEIPSESLSTLLSSPAAATLRSLAVQPSAITGSDEEERVSFYRVLATSPVLRNVQHLFLYGGIPADGVELLARAKNLAGVRRLAIQGLPASRTVLEKFARATWFRGLRHLRIALGEPSVAKALLRGIGSLPKLHTLDLPDLWKGAVKDLASGQFRALARLLYVGPLDTACAKALAQGKFPRLAAFVATNCGIRNEAFKALMRSDWFESLRVMDLSTNQIGDRSITALRTHPVAKSLRVLKLGENEFGESSFGLVSDPSSFPALSTLDLGSYTKRKGTSNKLSNCVASLQNPRLRHLNLKGWPLGDSGMKALAANPALAGLTRLDISSCQIGDAGARRSWPLRTCRTSSNFR